MKIESINFDERVAECVPTESVILNDLIGGGLRTGEFVVLEADTGCGKTTMMLRLALMALRKKQKVLYVSIDEEDEAEVAMRLMCMDSSIEYKGRNITSYTAEEIETLNKSKNSKFWDNLNIEYITDQGSIMSTINKYTAEGYKYIFVDYIGCIMPKTEESTYTFLTHVASVFKNFATKNNVCIMTTTQVTRAINAELRSDDLDPKTIDATFIADSIGIARKATVGMALFEYRGQKYLNVFKNRLNGRKEAIKLYIEPNTYKWIEIFSEDKGF